MNTRTRYAKMAIKEEEMDTEDEDADAKAGDDSANDDDADDDDDVNDDAWTEYGDDGNNNNAQKKKKTNQNQKQKQKQNNKTTNNNRMLTRKKKQNNANPNGNSRKMLTKRHRRVWISRFQQLEIYYKKFGHCHPTDSPRDEEGRPTNFELDSLAQWSRYQRIRFRAKMENNVSTKTGHITQHQIDLLSKMGYIWNLEEDRFEQRFRELIAYKAQYGNCHVPVNFKPNMQLGSWAKKQRQMRRLGTLPHEIITRFEELGFVWDPPSCRPKLPEHLRAKLKKAPAFEPALGLDVLVKAEFQSDSRSNKNKSKSNNHKSSNDTTALVPLTMLEEQRLLNDQREDAQLEEQRKQEQQQQVESDAWTAMFSKLLVSDEFCQFPNSRVPVSETFQDDPELAEWINTQRKLYRENRLHPDRVAQLLERSSSKSVSFLILRRSDHRAHKMMIKTEQEDPDPHQDQYQEGSNYAMAATNSASLTNQIPMMSIDDEIPPAGAGAGAGAKGQENNANDNVQMEESVSGNYTCNPWVMNQKSHAALVKSHQKVWNQRFQQLKVFKKKFGHANPTRADVDHHILAHWVRYQRARYRGGYKRAQLTQKEYDLLTALGVIWRPEANRWNQKYECLVRYKEKNGHCIVPVNTDAELGGWVKKQRKMHRLGKLSKDQTTKLNEIGFAWDAYIGKSLIDDRWETMFDRLQAFHKERGHCEVPKHYKKDGTLARWYDRQKFLIQRGHLPEHRTEELKTLGLVVDLTKDDYTPPSYTYSTRASRAARAPKQEAESEEDDTATTTTTTATIKTPPLTNRSKSCNKDKEEINLNIKMAAAVKVAAAPLPPPALSEEVKTQAKKTPKKRKREAVAVAVAISKSPNGSSNPISSSESSTADDVSTPVLKKRSSSSKSSTADADPTPVLKKQSSPFAFASASASASASSTADADPTPVLEDSIESSACAGIAATVYDSDDGEFDPSSAESSIADPEPDPEPRSHEPLLREPIPSSLSSGTRVAVYHSEGDEFQEGSVDRKFGRTALIEYDDGESEWIDIKERIVVNLGTGTIVNENESHPDLGPMRVGTRVSIWSPCEKEHYLATMVAKTSQGGELPHYLRYDNGHEEWTNLAYHTFSLV